MSCSINPVALGIVALASLAPISTGQAQLTGAAATRIIEGCAAHSRAKGQSHAIAVHDEGGHPVALLRMEGNTPGVTEFAVRKAVAVGYWRFSTAGMADGARETPGFGDAPHVVTVPGGIPVYSADSLRFIGSVGVSGEAPPDDVACAEAGVRAAALSLVRKRAG